MGSTSMEEPRCAPNTSLQVIESERLKASPSANTQLRAPVLIPRMRCLKMQATRLQRPRTIYEVHE